MVNIIDCELSGNNAAQGGAMEIRDVMELEMTRTRFSNNKATQNGGAIFFDCDSASNDCKLNLT
jgi:predicted outer membrane repeat protein